MYLFSTFNTNTNFILNKEKEYKDLVYKAEVELNLELDKIKKGNFSIGSKEIDELKLEKIELSKRIDVVDKNRGIYMVTVDARKNDEKIKLQGYEQCGGESVMSYDKEEKFE